MIMLEKWSSLSVFFLLQSFQPSRGCLSLWEDVCLPPVVCLLWALKLIELHKHVSLQSMSRFSTHTNEVNGWLLFSSQF